MGVAEGVDEAFKQGEEMAAMAKGGRGTEQGGGAGWGWGGGGRN